MDVSLENFVYFYLFSFECVSAFDGRTFPSNKLCSSVLVLTVFTIYY